MQREQKAKGLLNFGEKPPKKARRVPRKQAPKVQAAPGTIPQEINEVDKRETISPQDGGGSNGLWLFGDGQKGKGLYNFGQTGKGLYNFGGSGLAVHPKSKSYGASQNISFPQTFI